MRLCRVHKHSPIVQVLSQMKLVLPLQFFLLKIRFNITLPRTYRYSKRTISLRFCHTALCFPLLPRVTILTIFGMKYFSSSSSLIHRLCLFPSLTFPFFYSMRFTSYSFLTYLRGSTFNSLPQCTTASFA